MNLPASLLECLLRENALVLEFSAALDSETQALVDRTAFQQLPALTQQKESLALQLAALSDHRDLLLGQMGLAGGHDGTEHAAARDPQLAEAWQTLLANAAVARERNTRNSALVEVSLRYTQQSLDALRELGGLANAGTYDAQGRGRHGTYGGKSIVAA
ncbi:flagella synthesis protein FlgN [Bordetella sp. BOR01]|uniref:flagella synthesis protein FlgN n=1 Tax=Bordetella sp. BOR01 TaxID=2854779 RepID=UPI001C452644|nr:flagellar protein FlgN [Bordetella sp. BOR01]MBV7487070.1 flagellar protein FlgN [Bordetella sp. BOR01]